jgi:hypothetical protein
VEAAGLVCDDQQPKSDILTGHCGGGGWKLEEEPDRREVAHYYWNFNNISQHSITSISLS